jgi:hypothetical protein
MRRFWDAAVALDPRAEALDEGQRFPICNEGRLIDLFKSAGFTQTEFRVFDVPTMFRDFNDYWTPFLGGQGPAPTYVSSLPDHQRARLRARLQETVPAGPDGLIRLIARAFAVRGRRAS